MRRRSRKLGHRVSLIIAGAADAGTRGNSLGHTRPVWRIQFFDPIQLINGRKCWPLWPCGFCTLTPARQPAGPGKGRPSSRPPSASPWVPLSRRGAGCYVVGRTCHQRRQEPLRPAPTRPRLPPAGVPDVTGALMWTNTESDCWSASIWGAISPPEISECRQVSVPTGKQEACLPAALFSRNQVKRGAACPPPPPPNPTRARRSGRMGRKSVSMLIFHLSL